MSTVRAPSFGGPQFGDRLEDRPALGESNLGADCVKVQQLLDDRPVEVEYDGVYHRVCHPFTVTRTE